MNKVISPEPKRRNRNETRARLLRVGTEILSEKGYVGAGLEEVLERAEVPKGSFYYYFESKASFGMAVIDNYEYIWAQKLTRLLCDPSVPPLERIDNYIDEAVRGLEKYNFTRGCLIGNVGQEIFSLDEDFRDRIMKVFSSWARYVGTCLSEAKAQGDLSPEFDVDDAAWFFWSAWEGAILQAKISRSVEPIRRFRSVMFRYVLAGT